MSPTEELFGAYHFLLEDAVVRVRTQLRSAGLQASERGLRQALSGQPVTVPSDRIALAKLLAKLSGSSSTRSAVRRR